MTWATSLPSERAAIVATIDPDAYTAAAYSSDYVDMAKFESIMAVALVGTLGASATAAFKLQQATDSSGTGVKDITGKAITTITQASPDGSDGQAIINCRAEDLDMDNSFRYVKAVLTIATATSDAGAVIIGLNPKNGPASDNDLASVAEIV